MDGECRTINIIEVDRQKRVLLVDRDRVIADYVRNRWFDCKTRVSIIDVVLGKGSKVQKSIGRCWRARKSKS